METLYGTSAPPRILVVEDESVIRALMVEVLSDAGYEVDEANGSDAAMRLLGTDGYNLLVTDIHMPGKWDGLQIAQAAQAKHAALPVVFVTGRHDILNRLRRSGIAGAALPKPFDLDDFVQVVRDLVGPAEAVSLN